MINHTHEVHITEATLKTGQTVTVIRAGQYAITKQECQVSSDGLVIPEGSSVFVKELNFNQNCDMRPEGLMIIAGIAFIIEYAGLQFVVPSDVFVAKSEGMSSTTPLQASA